MSADPDRLFNLLPQYIRRRDAEAGGALRGLLAVLGEQADIVASGIEDLYDDWFIETCAHWAVPYLGDLVGYQALRDLGDPGDYGDPAGVAVASGLGVATRLSPRRDVAATVALRRSKGTLSLLGDIAALTAGWPARPAEFGPLLAGTAPVRLLPGDAAALRRRAAAIGGRLADLRLGPQLDLIGSPFDQVARTAEMPRINSPRRRGRYGPAQVGLFVWRLKPYAVTNAPAHRVDEARGHFTFSVLGAGQPLVTSPLPLAVMDQVGTSAYHPSAQLAGPDNVPGFITRRVLADRLADYYGPGKSFAIWPDDRREPVPPAAIVVADLSEWAYRPRRHTVAVDPELGRIAFGADHAPERDVRVTYHYAFSADMGGGEYPRTLADASGPLTYRVGPGERFERIGAAYDQWRRDNAEGGQPDVVIEITRSLAYEEAIELAVGPGERLALRAADGARPVLRLLDASADRPSALLIRGTGPAGQPGGRVALDGLLITGGGLNVRGPLSSLAIRHCTLVPGWSLERDGHPAFPGEPSIVLERTAACLQVERSITGPILVIGDEVAADPVPVHIADSIVDATARDRAAVTAADHRLAYAVVHSHRSTFLGEVHAHAIQIAAQTIFDGRVNVARRGVGCLRFSYLPPGSRAPRRYQCQSGPVRPGFTSTRYGAPGYGQLALDCGPEIARGAQDGAEMGAFHDLFQPQREDNLITRLAEFSPAGTDAGLIYTT
ncbi:MAG TPA: hypothetical protein VMG38_25020 [Trebonia sp.]|nr:hypothetical protein [Trebonia sp.]